ncbi:MAG: hypothetical protein H6716_24790 [Polyangiaceae bacterium]|nr:hypothetical protein [Polyangiaceae bacterium]
MNYSHPIIAERDPFIELRDTLCDNESIIDSLRYLILEEGYGRAEIVREFKGGGKLNRLVREACGSDKGFTMIVEVLESL